MSKISDDVAIFITGALPANGAVPAHLASQNVWHWSLTYGGKTFDDGGLNAREPTDAALNAIAKYRKLHADTVAERRRLTGIATMKAENETLKAQLAAAKSSEAA